jgi:hypothetical protein
MFSERSLKWLLFTAIGSVSPLLIIAIILLARGKWAGFGYLLDRGDLFLISAALLSSSIGDLFTSETKMRRTKTAILAISLLLGLTAAVWYAVILDCALANPAQDYDRSLTVSCSTIVFFSTLFVGLASIMLSKEAVHEH